jgi:adenine C2-methylase RlmN of 23S rRNA A2503 and tRNA A37
LACAKIAETERLHKKNITMKHLTLNAGVTATGGLNGKGHDIDAACGQLRLKQETAEGIV